MWLNNVAASAPGLSSSGEAQDVLRFRDAAVTKLDWLVLAHKELAQVSTN